MTDGTTIVLSKLASVLDMDAEAILTQSLRDFMAEQIAQSQQRMGQCYMEHQRFLWKYGMPWEAFLHALEVLEEQPEEQTTLQGVPLLEAVADSRWWAHVQEELAAETAKLKQLQALYKGEFGSE
jgi:hypothetical protein